MVLSFFVLGLTENTDSVVQTLHDCLLNLWPREVLGRLSHMCPRHPEDAKSYRRPRQGLERTGKPKGSSRPLPSATFALQPEDYREERPGQRP
jgi:hypothetical protein